MTEELVAMQVEVDPLENPADIEEPVAPPLQHFHAVVEPLHKPTGLPTLEVIGDLLQPSIDRPQKACELSQAACTHSLAPGPNRAFGPCLRIVALEQLCEVLPQVVSGLDFGRVGEYPVKQLPLLWLEIRRPLAKRPHRALELGILGLGQGSLES